MKTKIFIAIFILLQCLSVASAKPILNDNKILSWLVVLNNNEITLAKETLKKSTMPSIRHYAKLMINEHTKNLNSTLAFNPALEKTLDTNKDVIALKKQGKQELAKLSHLDGKKYDIEYINIMVNDHAAALQKLDNFIDKTEDVKLKNHLKMTAYHVKHHLEKAKEIQDKE